MNWFFLLKVINWFNKQFVDFSFACFAQESGNGLYFPQKFQ